MTTQNLSILQAIQHFSPKKQNTIAPKLPGRIHLVPKRRYSEPAPRKFARFEKKSKS